MEEVEVVLKITPYLGILVVIVSIIGLWFPILGYFLLIVFATLLLIAPFRGRWFCGNLCPRGSFMDFWVGRMAGKKRIPKILRSLWIRIPIFILMMGFMGYRLLNTQGLVNQIGMVFVIMCITTTAIAVVLGISIAPRTWCTFCLMGTAQRIIGAGKYQLQIDTEKCIECGKCEKVCPMNLKILEITDNPDCIKCGRCVEACPKNALSFKK
ncbi:4Fe-4S binding protein [Methanolobus sp. ZRKC3]|uniref:4Fe-4S binding protein n=1 Tax=Methanolobus sp. ZRKC3 TaxID=3125786 RepID=UPI00324F4C7E